MKHSVLIAGLMLALIGAESQAAEPKAGAKAGDVWVNGATYHCPTSRWFGQTKAGAYQPEAAAKAAGAQAAGGLNIPKGTPCNDPARATPKAPAAKAAKG